MNQTKLACIQKAKNFLWPTKHTLILFGIFSVLPILVFTGMSDYINFNSYYAAISGHLLGTVLALVVIIPAEIITLPFLLLFHIGFSPLSLPSLNNPLLAGLAVTVEFVYLYILSSAIMFRWNRKKQN